MRKWNGFIWRARCTDLKTGAILWEQERHNDLLDEGERSIVMSYFRAEEVPSQFYARLAYDSISLKDTLADIQREPVGNGYAPQLLERSSAGWPTIQRVNGLWQITSKEITFTASGGDIGPVNVMFLATTSDNTGKLISCVPFDKTQSVVDGQGLTLTLSTSLE